MHEPIKATNPLEEIEPSVRPEAINEIGRIVIVALRKAGFELRNSRAIRNPIRNKVTSAGRGTLRTNSGQARVFRIIQEFPGSRGFQIVVRAAEVGRPIKERTVRSALARLKKREDIEMREDGAWYPKETSK